MVISQQWAPQNSFSFRQAEPVASGTLSKHPLLSVPLSQWPGTWDRKLDVFGCFCRPMTPAPHVLGASQSRSHSCFHTCQPLAPIGLSPVASKPWTAYNLYPPPNRPGVGGPPQAQGLLLLEATSWKGPWLVPVLQHPSTQRPRYPPPLS